MLNPKEEVQLITLAEHYFRSNNYPFAETILKKILDSNPSNTKANEFLAYIAGNSGEKELAQQLLQKACQDPNCSPEALYYLGKCHLENDQHHEAIDNYLSSIKKAGEFFEVLHDLATAQSHIGDKDSALTNYLKAAKLNSNSYELFFNLGRLHDDFKEFNKSIDYYDQALKLKPDYAEAWSTKGATLHDLNLYDKALAHYDKAIQLKPEYAEAWSNKGHTLHELKRYDEALAHYDKAVQLKPDIDFLLGSLIHTKMKVCDWNDFNSQTEKLLKKINAKEKASTPFTILALSDSEELNRRAAEILVSNEKLYNPSIKTFRKKGTTEKISVGYYSADFHDHATSYLMAEFFELHDKEKFELIAFSFGPDKNDDSRKRLVSSFDQFIDVRDKSDKAIAELSNNIGIDIAVDLKGFTQSSRPNIFAYRAAPVQVNYLGYPSTMGADYIDYIIADAIVIPQPNQSSFVEKVVYLPNSYQINDRTRKISDKVFTRSEVGLPEDGFVFCCFNNVYKITPDMFDSWMRILNKVSESVLWLFEDNPAAAKNLRKEAIARGVSEERLVFAKRMPVADHLSRHRLADLFLDTLPYNAHTTASDALWSGLPVLTQLGNTFPGRVAASLLKAIDLPRLITQTQEEYESLAVELANHPEKLNQIKQELAANRLVSPLFNTQLSTKHIETAYKKMYERYQADLPPDHIYI
jgi:protein O-GlcNAc transferase